MSTVQKFWFSKFSKYRSESESVFVCSTRCFGYSNCAELNDDHENIINFLIDFCKSWVTRTTEIRKSLHACFVCNTESLELQLCGIKPEHEIFISSIIGFIKWITALLIFETGGNPCVRPILFQARPVDSGRNFQWCTLKSKCLGQSLL